MTRLFAHLGIAIVFTACFVPALAQLPTGSLDGIAKDPSGRVLQGAHVTATEESQATSRDGQTSSDGSFVLSNLEPGAYTVMLTCAGFSDVRYAHVQVQPGKVTTIDTTLNIATQSSTLQIAGDAEQQIDLAQSMLQGQISSSTIQSIPLNGRNFLELSFLLPGNRPGPNFDPTKTNTIEISSAGGFGRGGNILVDGADNNDEVVGGTLSNFPEDSIAEFQIATARFTAEVGRSGNSIINIVTRSGSNQVHGSAFLFERNRHLQGLPATFDRSQPVPRFDREQMGGSIGGPFRRDKAFYFSSLEFRDQNAALQTGTRVFTDAPYGGSPYYGHIINTAAAAPLRDLLLSNRADYHLDENNLLSLRYSFNRSTDTAQATAAQSTPFSTAAERQNALNRFHSAVANWTRIFGAKMTNDLSFHYDNFYNDIPPFAQNGSTTNPPLNLTNELLFPDLADGANFNLPQATRMQRYQLRDALTRTIGKHTLHAGAEFQHYHVKCFATHPPLLEQMLGIAQAMLFSDGALGRRNKELLATFVSSQNDCRYCADSHGSSLRQQGGSIDLLTAAMTCDLDSQSLQPQERELLRFVQLVTDDSQSIRPEDVEKLRNSGWTDLQIAETIHLAALFACFNRVVNAFGLPSQGLLELHPPAQTDDNPHREGKL